MKVLTAEQMRAADAAAIASGFAGPVLMENAAWGALRALEHRWPNLKSQRIAVFCGKGNNGGDGLALARLLWLHHRPQRLDILLAYAPEDLGADAAAQLRMLEELGVPYTMQVPLDIAATGLAIDAMLGTGAKGTPREPLADWIALCNSLPLAQRVALDVPSGIGSEVSIEAHLTITFGAAKQDLVLPPEGAVTGEVLVVDIGIPEKHYASAKLHQTTSQSLHPIGSPRDPASHKGTYGHIAILGGASGKHGALHLASEAALRSGAGLVTAYSPDAAFAPRLPDVMRGDWSAMHRQLEGKRVVALGPGLGQSDELRELVNGLYHHWPATMVFDADALNLLAPLQQPPATLHARILTPHPGEMERLLGRPIQDRLADARTLAANARCTVILKGQRTLIAFPDGNVWVNPTGSPALAKGGSGDVLTGMLAAFLAQYPQHPEPAILAAVYLHGRCGSLAAAAQQELCSLASQLLDHLPAALAEIQ
jgi:NAD(P)H-hydrate epimerase